MKKIFYFMLAVLPMMFASCSSSDDVKDLDPSAPVKMTLNVAFPQMGGATNSRATVDLTGIESGSCKVDWEDDDSFVVYGVDGSEIHKMKFIKGSGDQFTCDEFYKGCTSYAAYYPELLNDEDLTKKLAEQDGETPFIYMSAECNDLAKTGKLNFKHKLCICDLVLPVCYFFGSYVDYMNRWNSVYLDINNKYIESSFNLENKTFVFSLQPATSLRIHYFASNRSEGDVDFTYSKNNLMAGKIYYLNRSTSDTAESANLEKLLNGFVKSVRN